MRDFAKIDRDSVAARSQTELILPQPTLQERWAAAVCAEFQRCYVARDVAAAQRFTGMERSAFQVVQELGEVDALKLRDLVGSLSTHADRYRQLSGVENLRAGTSDVATESDGANDWIITHSLEHLSPERRAAVANLLATAAQQVIAQDKQNPEPEHGVVQRPDGKFVQPPTHREVNRQLEAVLEGRQQPQKRRSTAKPPTEKRQLRKRKNE